MSPLLSFVLLFLIIFISSFQLSQAALHDNFLNADSSESSVDEQRRTYDFKKLRHFLLTSNAEQRAARREQGDFYKRQLIREYLDSINDFDSDRLEEVKKRFTYCSVQDILNESLCRRRALHH